MVFSVDSCCCGCTTRTGCMIIAIINLISGILIFISSDVVLIYLLKSIFNENDGYSDYYALLGLGSYLLVILYGIIFGVLKIIMGPILIMGVKQRNAKLVRIALFLGFITTMVSTGLLLGGCIAGVIEMYCLLIVYSEYKKMLESTQGDNQAMQPSMQPQRFLLQPMTNYT